VIFELKFKLAEDGKDHDLGSILSKTLPQTDPVPSIKRHEAHRVPLFPTRSEEVLAGRVETFRYEIFRILPLLFVTVQGHNVQVQFIIRFDRIFSKLHILGESFARSRRDWRLESQAFIDATLKIVEV